MRHTLRKSEILRGRKNFQNVFDRGERIEGKILRCVVVKNSPAEGIGSSNIGVAFVVPRSIRRAVDRNRVKRLMRESYRLNKEILRPFPDRNVNCVSVIFLFSPLKRFSSHLPTFSEIEDDMKFILNAVAQWKP